MKRIPQITLGLIIILFLFSCHENNENPQPVTEIPNADFENWQPVLEFEKPDSWGTSNLSLFGVVSFTTVTKETADAYSGSYCPRLETKSQILNDAEVKVVGLVTLGNFDVNIETKKARISGGIPFISKPSELEGYYKYIPVENDSCFIVIAITKFNQSASKQDTIGYGKFSSAAADWTAFNIPIQYNLNQTPDSMNIVILSSDTSIFNPGSTLWVDNLHLKY